jgi:hypothetical protein
MVLVSLGGAMTESADRGIRFGMPPATVWKRLSSDGVPAVLHEERLDGSTTSRGLVGERTADELARIRLRVDGRATLYPIPRLDDVLSLVGRSRRVFLDVKDASIRDSGMAGALVASIRKHDVQSTVKLGLIEVRAIVFAFGR